MTSLTFQNTTFANPALGDGYELTGYNIPGLEVKEVKIPFTSGVKMVAIGTKQTDNRVLTFTFKKLFTSVENAIAWVDGVATIKSDTRNSTGSVSFGLDGTKTYPNMWMSSCTISNIQYVYHSNFKCYITGSVDFTEII